MKHARGRPGILSIRVGAAALWIVAALPPVAAEGPGSATEHAGTVHWQATFADGTVRDLNEVPTTREGIRRVVRITRYQASLKGYEVLTTEGPAVRLVNRGWTVHHDLVWSGKVWVGPKRKRPRSAPTKSAAPADALRRETRMVEVLLRALRGRLKELDHAVGEAERKLTKVKDTESEPAARVASQEAKDARDKTVETIEEYQRKLAALRDAARYKEPVRPVGKVEHLRRAPDSQLGVVNPITNRAVLPHRVQVWKLPPAKGKRTYTVAMAHPEAGRFGAFRYIAYEDTDGDGRPDKLIARSPLATANAPHEWTQWAFTTTGASVYVGNAWEEGNVGVYCHRAPPRAANWRGLGTQVYVSPALGIAPHRRWGAWPYFTNIRVHVNQSADAPPYTGPEVVEEPTR